MRPESPPRRRRRGRRLLLVLLATLVLALAALGLAIRRALPPDHGHFVLATLGAPVAVHLDARARPFVRAAAFRDALAAEGFLHARERLWQMELLRRAGQGRLAELLGPGLLATDRELWRYGVPQLARRIAADAPPGLAADVAAYVGGVNAALASAALRPPEFLLLAHAPQPWRAADVYAVAALMAFDSAGNARNELLRLALRGALTPAEYAAFAGGAPAADYPYVLPAAVDAALARHAALDALAVAGLPSLGFGSNGWVVAPTRSASGHALFAFDSHDALALPNLFYEVHLFFGADEQLRGWSVPGLPGVVNGYNDRFAWGFTNIGDSQDLFLEDALPPVREHVEIPVRGRSAPERLALRAGRHGPIVVEDPPLSLAWTGHAIGAEGFVALLALNRARDRAALDAALDAFAAPVANVTWASVDGEIGFRTVGRVPRRTRGEGLAPEPAASGGWSGGVPATEMPRRTDPPEGFLAAANARVAPPGEGPLISADNAPPYRIARIREVLAASRAHDLETMRALQLDWHNGQAAVLLPALLPALADAADADPVRRAAHAALAAWAAAPVNAPEAAAPLLFERWYLALARALFAERLGPERYRELLRRSYVLNDALDRLILASPDAPWWRGDRDARVREAFADAVASLVVDFGPDPARWRWDAWHAVQLRHELGRAAAPLAALFDRGPFPWGGGPATVGRANTRYDDPSRVVHGATVRVVAELTRPIRAAAVMPGGQSGHPWSPHYDDQTGDWLAGRLQPIAPHPEAVAGPALRLLPAAVAPGRDE